MAQPKSDKIEYVFEDLRRNTDPVPNLVLAQLDVEEDEGTERQEGKPRKDVRKKKDRKDDDDDLDLDDEDEDIDDDEEVTLTRKELARTVTEARRQAERNARRDIEAARAEAAQVIGKLEKRIDGIETSGKQESIAAEFDGKIADLEASLEKAMEAGETDQVRRLNREIAELVADKKIKLAAEEARQKDQHSEIEDLHPEGQPRKATDIPRAQEWLDEQDEDWFNDPEQQHVRAYLVRVDKELRRRGFDPTTDEYYEKLERKIDKKFPGVVTLTMDDRVRRRRGNEDDDDVDDEDDDFADLGYADRRKRKDRGDNRRQQRRAAERSPVSDGNRGGADRESGERRQRRNGEVTLTRRHLANMRAFGLDPENPKHVEEYQAEVRRNQ